MRPRRRPTRRPGLLLLIVLPVLGFSAFPGAVAQADAQPNASAPTDHTVVSHDGTPIAATLYRADAPADTPRPGILTTHGWAADRTSRAADARWLNQLGYHVLAYDSRGFGESGGLVGMNGPEEVADVSALIDWWATHAANDTTYALRLDGPTDPRLGMTGVSYGGAIQLLAAAADPRIDAIAPDITWHDLEGSLAPSGVVKRGWVDMLFWAGTLGAHGLTTGTPDHGGLDPRLRDWYLQAMTTGRMPTEAREPLAERSPRTVLDRIDADVLLMQGWSDTLFGPDEAVATYQALAPRADAETRLVMHDGGHSSTLSATTQGVLRRETATFLAVHLDDATAEPGPAVHVIDPRTGGWSSLDPWAATATFRTLPLSDPDGARQVTLAQTPAPTSHTEQQALSATLPARTIDTPLPTHVLLDTGLEGPLTITGRPTLTLDARGDAADATLFASLASRDGAGDLHTIDGQVAPFRLVPRMTDDALRFDLVSLHHSLPVGHTLHVRITTTDSAYHASRDPGQLTLDLTNATLDLPVASDGVPVRPDPATEPTAGPTSEDRPAPGPTALIAFLVIGAALMLARRVQPRN